MENPQPGADDAPAPRRRRPWLIGLVAVVVLAVAAFVTLSLTRDDFGPDLDFSRPAPEPEDALKEAKANLDETEGVKIAITAEDIPEDLQTGLVSADGTAVRPASFSGEISVRASGFAATADVIAVDGTTYVKGAVIFPDWTPIEPEQFNAPDPSTLLDPDSGISGFLTGLDDIEVGEAQRDESDGSLVLTPYSGTLPAETVRTLIPGAQDGEFDTTYLIDDDGFLREARLSGAFYPDEDDMTYVVTFADYGETIEIVEP